MDIAIRKFREDDASAFYEAVMESVEHISVWLPWCTQEYGIEDAIDWVASAEKAWHDGSDYRFLIEDATNGEILGSVGINQIVTQHKIGNLRYWVRKSALNKGVCTKAARLTVEYAFRELGFQRVEIHVLTNNQASISVASKLGGVYEGEFRNKLIYKGHPKIAKCYSIIPSDYETYTRSSLRSAL